MPNWKVLRLGSFGFRGTSLPWMRAFPASWQPLEAGEEAESWCFGRTPSRFSARAAICAEGGGGTALAFVLKTGELVNTRCRSGLLTASCSILKRRPVHISIAPGHDPRADGPHSDGGPTD
jgi:hypothetical protein